MPDKLLVKEFCQAALCDTSGQAMPHAWAIHENETNPHFHVIYSRRGNDGVSRPSPELFFKRANKAHPEQGGAAKDKKTDGRDWLKDLRRQWANLANRHLDAAGLDARIDARSLKNQGLDRVSDNAPWHEREKFKDQAAQEADQNEFLDVLDELQALEGSNLSHQGESEMNRKPIPMLESSKIKELRAERAKKEREKKRLEDERRQREAEAAARARNQAFTDEILQQQREALEDFDFAEYEPSASSENAPNLNY